MLKKIRLILAIIIGALFTYIFIDFTGTDPHNISRLAHTQLVPAILAGSGFVVVLIIATLLLGRVYCSVLCPLGILQDVILRIKIWARKLKVKNRRFRTRYEEPYNALRYSILAISIITYISGFSVFLLLLDPYSNFGRIVTNIFKPVYLLGNNLIAFIANRAGNYDFYNVHIEISSLTTLILSATILSILIIFVIMRERIWCNTICPVGALLGLISKVSLFKIVIDESKCTHCKKCVSSCKSRCINDEEIYIDSSRCVKCFNCTTKCDKNALKYKVNLGLMFPKKVTPRKPISKDKTTNQEPSVNTEKLVSRKEVLTIGALAIASGVSAVTKKSLNIRLDASRYPLPPGAGSVERFQSKCTACQLCVSKCPSHLLRPALFENGINGLMQPYMDFNVHRFCEYECKVCIDVCPNHALQKITLEEKKLTQVGVVKFDIERCVVKELDQYCGACGEHCPTQAVHMVEYKAGLTIPKINPSICIGCGACESICPVRPDAIYVERNIIQKIAEAPEIKKSEEIEVEGFGF